jgi:ribonuclease HII
VQQKCKYNYIAGVDEAGRGPLAGPVVAAAVILNPTKHIVGIKDSKLLSIKKRQELFAEIYANCLAVGVGICSSIEIDQINILQATLLAMHKAVLNLSIIPYQILVDGNYLPKWNLNAKAIIGGDRLESCISAASIIAKVTRDQLMINLDQTHPEYGFAQHKGYGTKQHFNAIKKYGTISEHRNSFLKKLLITT